MAETKNRYVGKGLQATNGETAPLKGTHKPAPPPKLPRRVKPPPKEKAEQLDVLTVEQVAEILQVGMATVLRWIRSGRIPATKIGRLWRVRREDLAAVLNPEKEVPR